MIKNCDLIPGNLYRISPLYNVTKKSSALHFLSVPDMKNLPLVGGIVMFIHKHELTMLDIGDMHGFHLFFLIQTKMYMLIVYGNDINSTWFREI
jgi:hypothetical protein